MKIIDIEWYELQEYLDKYGDTILFILPYQMNESDANGGWMCRLVVKG